jgi:hypothetical protein
MKMVIIAQKLSFCDLKNTMMSLESLYGSFTKILTVLRPSIAESFSLAAEGHRKRGKFSVDLSYSLALLCIQPFDTMFFLVYFNKIPSNLMNSLSMEKIPIMAISTHPQDA